MQMLSYIWNWKFIFTIAAYKQYPPKFVWICL